MKPGATRRFSVFLFLTLAGGCASLVGLEDDYRVVPAPSVSGQGGASPTTAGRDGVSGEPGSGTAGSDRGGSAPQGVGGDEPAGQAGAPNGGASNGGVPSSGGGEAGQGGAPPVVCEPRCHGDTPLCENGTCVAPPSCAGLAEICGASGAETCCVQDDVPGDTFNRTFDGVLWKDASNPANIGGFTLDREEVTVGRFRKFVIAGAGNRSAPPATGAGTHPSIAGTGWKASFDEALVSSKAALVAALNCEPTYRTWTDTVGGNEARPINCVTWYEAFAFCIWDGGRLPTEAEWNLAAAGGSEHRVYPWSSPPKTATIGPAQASYYVDDAKQCYGDGVVGCAATDIVVAGSKAGAGAWGHRDLAGNVMEWVFDYYSASYQNPCVDCAELDASLTRSLRGGSFGGDALSVSVGSRNSSQPLTRSADVGFRCAYGGGP